jgi:hypothetical protein
MAMTPKAFDGAVCTAHRSPPHWSGGKSGKNLRRSGDQNPNLAHARQPARVSNGSRQHSSWKSNGRRNRASSARARWSARWRCAGASGSPVPRPRAPTKSPRRWTVVATCSSEIAESIQHAWLLHQLVEQFECLQCRAAAPLDVARRLPRNKVTKRRKTIVVSNDDTAARSAMKRRWKCARCW